MTEADEIAKALHLRIVELERAIAIVKAGRPFVEISDPPDNQLIEIHVSHIDSVVQKSDSLVSLIDDFLASNPKDGDALEKADRLLAQARSEIERFRERKDFGDIIHLSDDPAKLQ